MFLPFLGLGAAIRPTWIPLVIGLAFSAIWIYGLGLPGFLAAAIGTTLGVFAGNVLRHAVLAFRARRVAARMTTAAQPGDTA